LLDNNREKDMVYIYNLLLYIIDNLDPLLLKFESYLRKAGLAAITKTILDTNTEKLEPKYYISIIYT
jgi:hypothetical protein